MTTLVSETLCVMNIDLLRDSQIQLCQLLYIPCELSQLLEHLWAGLLSPDRRPQVLPQTLEVFAHLYECGADEGVASSTSPSADPNSVCQPKKKRRDVVCDPNVSQTHHDCV